MVRVKVLFDARARIAALLWLVKPRVVGGDLGQATVRVVSRDLRRRVDELDATHDDEECGFVGATNARRTIHGRRIARHRARWALR